MLCEKCKASYWYGYVYPQQECMIRTLSEPVQKDYGCELHYKTIEKRLKEMDIDLIVEVE